MIFKRVIFVIPGFRQTTKSKAYQDLAKSLRREGYTPKLISIPWKNSTILDNTEYFLEKYKSVKSSEKYILGFSYGAMIAFIASTKVSSDGVVLCSLSPYFSEDTNLKSSSAISKLAKLRYQDFSKLHASKLAEKTKAKKVVMMYGTHEARALISRVRKTFADIHVKEKSLFLIPKTDHNIGNKKYLLTINKAAANLTRPL